MIYLERRAYENAIRDARYTCRALIKRRNVDGLRFAYREYRQLMKDLYHG